MDLLNKMLKVTAGTIATLALLSACSEGSKESSAQRDARTAQRLQTPAAQALLNNQWCAFVDSTGGLSPQLAMRGFLRLTFMDSDLMTVERFAEADGKPFGKSDDDKTGLWRIEDQTLHVRLDKNTIKQFNLSFASEKNIPVMKMKAAETAEESVLFWVCNQGVEDPMPIEIKPEDNNPPPPDEIPEVPDFPEDIPEL